MRFSLSQRKSYIKTHIEWNITNQTNDARYLNLSNVNIHTDLCAILNDVYTSQILGIRMWTILNCECDIVLNENVCPFWIEYHCCTLIWSFYKWPFHFVCHIYFFFQINYVHFCCDVIHFFIWLFMFFISLLMSFIQSRFWYLVSRLLNYLMQSNGIAFNVLHTDTAIDAALNKRTNRNSHSHTRTHRLIDLSCRSMLKIISNVMRNLPNSILKPM